MNVDWTLLLGIVGVIFYVIVPLLAGNKKKDQQKGTPSAKRPQQPQRQQPQQTQRTASPQTQQQASTAPSSPPAEPRNLREFLEQIQRQVREAEQEWQAAQQQQASSPQPAPEPVAQTPPVQRPATPAASPLVSTPERRLSELGTSKRASQSLGRMRPKARRASVRSIADLADEQPVLQDAFVQVTPERVLHGLIWHEILSEPKGLRGIRRSRLPLR